MLALLVSLHRRLFEVAVCLPVIFTVERPFSVAAEL